MTPIEVTESFVMLNCQQLYIFRRDKLTSVRTVQFVPLVRTTSIEKGSQI
jgi:hypothetical protein